MYSTTSITKKMAFPKISIFFLQVRLRSAIDSNCRLCQASRDIRNVVKSVARLPVSYTEQCEIIANDKDFDIVARNFILLLIALHFGPEKEPSSLPFQVAMAYQ